MAAVRFRHGRHSGVWSCRGRAGPQQNIQKNRDIARMKKHMSIKRGSEGVKCAASRCGQRHGKSLPETWLTGMSKNVSKRRYQAALLVTQAWYVCMPRVHARLKARAGLV